MYKIFLCLRYLRTRYIVLASIISVMLGVATMIVVNSVMAGFAHEMQSRIHGILGDVMVTSTSSDGFFDPEGQMKKIRATLGDDVVGMTPICTTVGVMTYKTHVMDAFGTIQEAQLTEQVCIVGIDETSKGQVGDFSKFLQHPENRKQISFELREGGYDTCENQPMRQSRGLIGWLFPKKETVKKDRKRKDMEDAGWEHRRKYYGETDYEIITNMELNVEAKTSGEGELPSMKTAEGSEAPCLSMMDDHAPAVPPSDHPMENPPEVPTNGMDWNAAAAVVENSEAEKNAESGENAEPGESAESGESVVSEGSSPFERVLKKAETGAETEGDFVADAAVEPETAADSVAEAAAEPKTAADSEGGFDPFGSPDENTFSPLEETHPGIVVGMGMAMYRTSEGEEQFLLTPGRDLTLTFPNCSIRPEGVTAHFTCVDLYESKMSEYDSQFVFVPMKVLQDLRGMPNKANQIQIQLREGADLDVARDRLQKVFDPQLYTCRTWRDDKMPLLQAVDMEIAILNVLLFMIIAVSGFGILAIFYMVVTDKTRDIGILKALGASSRGIMSIFLMYGLSLGIVGAGLGLILGLLFVCNINEIADLLSTLMGHEVFSPDIYYFYQIPYDISFTTIGWIVGGALIIAVLASVFPAWHASRLQPVESLRYE